MADNVFHQDDRQMSRKKGWAVLLVSFFFLYLFAVSIGPWLRHHIWGMDAVVQTIEENNIDSGAYYYTEIKGAEDGYAYLTQSMQSMAPDQYGLTLPFISGLVACALILYFGFKTLPR